MLLAVAAANFFLHLMKWKTIEFFATNVAATDVVRLWTEPEST